MNRLVGLFVVCVLLPGCYAGIMYFLCTNTDLPGLPERGAVPVAVIAAVPLVLSGFVKWWDVWIKPAPKMGADWQAIPPGEYLVEVAKGHGVILGLIIIVQLVVGGFAQGRADAARQDLEKAETQLAEATKKEKDAIEAKDRARDKQTPADQLAKLEKQAEEATAERAKSEEELKTLKGTGRPKISGWSMLPPGLLLFAALVNSLHIPHYKRFMSGSPIVRGA